jgi:hypothetical protein
MLISLPTERYYVGAKKAVFWHVLTAATMMNRYYFLPLKLDPTFRRTYNLHLYGDRTRLLYYSGIKLIMPPHILTLCRGELRCLLVCSHSGNNDECLLGNNILAESIRPAMDYKYKIYQHCIT